MISFYSSYNLKVKKPSIPNKSQKMTAFALEYHFLYFISQLEVSCHNNCVLYEPQYQTDPTSDYSLAWATILWICYTKKRFSSFSSSNLNKLLKFLFNSSIIKFKRTLFYSWNLPWYLMSWRYRHHNNWPLISNQYFLRISTIN